MDTPTDTAPTTRGAAPGPAAATLPTRPVARRPAAASAGRRLLARLVLAACATGCAASNYDFDALAEVAGDTRALQLSEDLLQAARDEGHQGLFELDVIPLVRSRLAVFTASEEDHQPEGFVELDLQACLPFFGIVDATLDRYDDERRPLEHHEYGSWLWGLFQTHSERIETTSGPRERTSAQLLWFLDWHSEPEYPEAAPQRLAGDGDDASAPGNIAPGADQVWWPEPFKEPWPRVAVSSRVGSVPTGRP